MTTATHHFSAPVSGKCVPVETAHNVILSRKALGDGVVIFPSEGIVTAPFDCIITCTADHAVTILDPAHNIQMLLCADTDVSFFVQSGQKVKKDTPLFHYDNTGIRAHGGNAELYCILTNLFTADISVFNGDVTRGKSRIMSCECIG